MAIDPTLRVKFSLPFHGMKAEMMLGTILVIDM